MQVLVTRPEHLAGNLCQAISEQGWQAVRFPCLAVESLPGANLSGYNVLIFISPNAVEFADLSQLQPGQKIIAMGPGTQAALMIKGLSSDVPPVPFTSEALLEMPALKQVSGQRIGVVAGLGGRDMIVPKLNERGAQAKKIEVYQRIQAKPDRSLLPVFWQDPHRVIIITSQQSLANLLALVPKSEHQQLFQSKLVVPSVRIKESDEAQQFQNVVVSKSVRTEDIVDVIR